MGSLRRHHQRRDGGLKLSPNVVPATGAAMRSYGAYLFPPSCPGSTRLRGRSPLGEGEGPGIHVFGNRGEAWMAGTSPAMTAVQAAAARPFPAGAPHAAHN